MSCNRKWAMMCGFIPIVAILLMLPAVAAVDKNLYHYEDDGVETPLKVFNENFNYLEDLTHSYATLERYGSKTKSKTFNYVTRTFDGDIILDFDAKIGESFRVVIGPGNTLIIQEDTTLTILGELYISGGIVENHGAILLGAKPRENSFLQEEDEKKSSSSLLRNQGTLINQSVISLHNGSIANEGTGILQNNGTLNIQTKDASITALSNVVLFDGAKNVSGTIINSGAIYVENTVGIGIQNYIGAVFQNNGDIYKSQTGSIGGTISGNAVLES